MSPEELKIVEHKHELLWEKSQSPDLTDGDWIEIYYEATDLIQTPELPTDLKGKMILGICEISCMIYDGIKSNRGETPDYLAKTEEEQKKIREYDLKIAKDLKKQGVGKIEKEEVYSIFCLETRIMLEYTEIREGKWENLPGMSLFYIKGNDAMIFNQDRYVTTLEGSIDYDQIKNAKIIETRVRNGQR